MVRVEGFEPSFQASKACGLGQADVYPVELVRTEGFEPSTGFPKRLSGALLEPLVYMRVNFVFYLVHYKGFSTYCNHYFCMAGMRPMHTNKLLV